MTEAATTRIAAYAADARETDLPEPVRREALRSLLNILGCMLEALGIMALTWPMPR